MIKISKFQAATGMVCLAGVLAWGCSQTPEEVVGSTVQRVEGSLAAFSMSQAALLAQPLLAASEWLEIGDRTVVDTQGSNGVITNSGTGVLRVGTDATVGPVIALGNVDLRDRATVQGGVLSAATVSQGNQVTVTQSITIASPGPLTNVSPSLPSIPTVGGHIRLEPNQTASLEPGGYGELSVKQGAVVTLAPGFYSFTRVFLEPGGTLKVSSKCDPTTFVVTEALFFRGSVQDAAGEDLRIAPTWLFSGPNTAHIEAPFEGNVLAPSAELILNSATHRGRFAAKRLRVQSNATILAPRDIGEPPAQCGIVTPEAPPSVTIRELPMPPLVTAADAPAFLEWLFRIRQQELQQAQDAIFAVRTDASIVQAVIARFEQERAAGNWTWALMCLEMLGAMDGSAESYLISLLQTPLPPATVLEEEELLMTPREVEAAYRRPAIFSLAGRPSPAARQAVEDAAHSHPDKGLRGESIRALVHGQPASYVADLRASIQTGDQHFFDRPERRDPNFKTKVSNYLATYGN